MKSKTPQVTSIDVYTIKAEIKKCPIDVQQYISALERSLERQKSLTKDAIKKIKELSKPSLKEEEKECSKLEHESGLTHSGKCLICGEKS